MKRRDLAFGGVYCGPASDILNPPEEAKIKRHSSLRQSLRDSIRRTKQALTPRSSRELPIADGNNAIASTLPAAQSIEPPQLPSPQTPLEQVAQPETSTAQASFESAPSRSADAPAKPALRTKITVTGVGMRKSSKLQLLCAPGCRNDVNC